jgi:hypothetical protein
MGTLALSPFSASADATATTLTVTGPANITTGHAATFVAVLTPAKTDGTPPVKATGTVNFTITGTDNSTVSCVTAPVLSAKGKATCKVGTGSLLASAGPYAVTASYSGDANFAASNDSISQVVSSANTHISLSFDPKPTPGAATVVTATMSGGSGALPTGIVSFVVTADYASKAAMLNCGDGKASGNFQPLASNGAAKPQAVATCDLVAGWWNLPTNANVKVTSWKVTATYDGDSNYGQVQVFKQGRAKA